MTKILVTGGAGYIGSHIVLELLDAGFEVVVVDDLSGGFENLVDKRAIFEKANIGDSDKISKIIDEHYFAGVIHLAGFICVSQSVIDPLSYYKNNVVASLNFLEVLRRKKVTNFIFSSSAAVFGNVSKEQIPINESCQKNPINPYGASKLMVENILADIAASSDDFKFVILRYFNACGADLKLRSGECHNPETHLIPLAIKAAIGQNQEIRIFGNDFQTPDGTCIRDYIHVSDLAQIHIDAIKYLIAGGESDSFNCGYKKGFSVQEIIEAVKRNTGKNFEAIITKRREGDPDILIADNAKLINKLGFRPKYDNLDVIIKSTYNWQIKGRSKKFKV
jgi:UDP-glucose 4-epimerase